MANLQMDPMQSTEVHITNMFHQCHLLTTVETPWPVPHPAATCIDYHIGVKDSLIKGRVAITPSNPDQLVDVVSQAMLDREGQEVQVFDVMGNIHPEVLAKIPRMGLMIGSGEPPPGSGVNGLDCGETFAFGNDGLD